MKKRQIRIALLFFAILAVPIFFLIKFNSNRAIPVGARKQSSVIRNLPAQPANRSNGSSSNFFFAPQNALLSGNSFREKQKKVIAVSQFQNPGYAYIQISTNPLQAQTISKPVSAGQAMESQGSATEVLSTTSDEQPQSTGSSFFRLPGGGGASGRNMRFVHMTSVPPQRY